MRGAWWVVIASLLTTGQVYAQRPRAKSQLMSFDFRGHPMGESRWEGLSCTPISSETGRNEQWCHDPDNHIGDASAEITYLFADDSLVQISFSYSPEDYEEIVAAFSQKFGKPHSGGQVPVQNRMGAQFTNALASWQTRGGELTLVRYAGNLDEGFGSIRSPAEAAREQKRKQAARKKPNV